MTINLFAKQLLTHFSPEERTIPDSVTYPGRNADVALAMNAALQEVFAKGSPWVRYEERGSLLYAPAAVTISVTQGSAAAVISSGWAAWMAGCSIVISGSSFDNQIRNDDAAAILLKIPHDGPTGSVSAMVYQDSVTLASDILEVCEPVKVDRRQIAAMPSSEYPAVLPGEEDYRFHLRNTTFPEPLRVAERIGRPVGFTVETWSKSAVIAAVPRLKLQPAPAEAGVVEYRAMLKPPVTFSDLTLTTALPIPFEYIQSIFYPIARKRLSASQFFRSGIGQDEIDRSYMDALGLLASLNPRPAAGMRFRTPY